MKNIIVLGDSFTYGHGCSDREFRYNPSTDTWEGNQELFDSGPSKYCWASLLASHYKNYNVLNLSKPGNDNSYMLKGAYENVSEDTALIIYSGTINARMHVNGYSFNELNTWVMAVTNERDTVDVRNAKENFLRYLYHDEVFHLYSINALYAAFSLSKIYNTKFIWSTPEDITLKKHASILDSMRMSTAIYYKNKDSKYRANDNHLNNIGHESYFQEIVLPKVNQILGE